MSVTACNPISSVLTVDAELHRTYTSIYEVLVDSRLHGPLTAVTATGIPAYASAYTWGSEYDNWAFCNGATASFREDPKTSAKVWRVTVTHSTRPRSRESGTGPGGAEARQNPLDEPPQIYGSFLQFSRQTDKDKDDEPTTNSSNEKKLCPLDDNRHSLVIEVNTPTIDLAQWADYRICVNSAAIWGLGARQAKLQRWDWRVLYYGIKNWYISHHYEFHISREVHPDASIGWNYTYLDEGTRELNDDWTPGDPDTYYKTFMDSKDQVLHFPLPLDGTGHPVDPGGTPVWLTKELYPERDFTTLPGIPNPLPGPFA